MAKKKQTYLEEIGDIIFRARLACALTQAELAEKVGTSQSAINRIENGKQNISLEMVEKLSKALNTQILSVNDIGTQGYRINGGKRLRGSINTNTSKNAAVALLCASLLNKDKTILKHLARIEEVYRIIEVLNSIGVRTKWINRNRDLEIIPPDELKLEEMDLEAARRTRSIIMLLGALMHKYKKFRLPYAGGCSLGSRTVEPHLQALDIFGLRVDATSNSGFYEVEVRDVPITETR